MLNWRSLIRGTPPRTADWVSRPQTGAIAIQNANNTDPLFGFHQQKKKTHIFIVPTYISTYISNTKVSPYYIHLHTRADK